MTTPPTAARPRAAWTLLITSAATFMAALDNLVVTTALPVIRTDLGGSLSDLEWIVNGYVLPFACLLLLAAALGDRFGRRRVFAGGVVLFTAASAAAALSESTGMLIASRAAQGIGAAVLMPLSLTLISAAVPAERRGTAFGIWGAVNGLAVAGGPLVGGTITEHLSWHWIFWLNVPLGLALLPLVRTRLTESRGPNNRLDVLGTVLVSGGMFGIVLSIVRGHEHGWTSPAVLTGFALGGLLLAGFIRWEQRSATPMLPMGFFRSPTFTAVNFTGLIAFFGIFGSIFLLTQFLQLIQGYNPQQAGLRMLPWTAMPMLVAPLAGILTDRIGGKYIVMGGMVFQAAGLAWFALVNEPAVSYGTQVPGFVLCGVGMGMFFAPTGAMVMGSVPQEKEGIASGVNNAMREVGGALGVAVLASVFAARGGYASPQEFTDGIVPALWVGVIALLAAAAGMAAVPGRRRRAAPPPPDRAPLPGTPAPPKAAAPVA
ncbi:MFS transporter [Streptomyces aidingensis]|uniref:Drug resistance transporter, EmrB/QacA subfamily n=1 Tax=Streptomyces aidingensis TaxID=910347 RepID=A0A1I1E5M7_9ACTN|nr:MFS transporter [Streptomyces aidingensis]SFB81976.1 drug resistance transporter, EmrB/QacA subfamily [Streptomyces aidingensis]